MDLSRYRSRASAGQMLAQTLGATVQPRSVVLALPRGGVEVAAEVAKALGLELDVFVVHKLAAADQPDQIVGAVTSRGVCVLNRAVLQQVEVDPAALASAIARERNRVEERELFYRGALPEVELENRPVVLVTDGIASAVTMRAAIAAVRKQSPSWLTVAAPVGMAELCDQLREEVEEVVCPLQPAPFFSIGLSYEQFPPLTDERIHELLVEADQRRHEMENFFPHEIFPSSYLDGARF